MAVIITLDTLKNILKKFQGIIFNKYDNKIDTLDTDVNTRLGSLNSEFDTKLSNKVDKVSDKDLSTNDFTDEEKEKLASLSNYNDTELLEKINQIRPGYFTYIVKDNETLKNWAENVEGNDYSHILILGVELEYNGNGYVRNSSTQSIYALGGNKILSNGFRGFKNVYGVNRVGNSMTTGLGFADCEYLTDCTFTNEWQREDGGFGLAFSNCNHLNNCTIYSNWAGFGFSNCNYVNNCSYINHCEDACDFSDFGFSSCNYVRNCIYDVTQTTGGGFGGCYSDDGKTPCSNTVEGGFNFSNKDEDIASLKTDLTQEITDRKNADTDIQKSINTTVNNAIAEIVANSPEDFNTLKEIADWIDTHEDSASAINTAIQTNKTNIDKKVDKVSGKGLSTNDYTTAEKNKLAGISTGANKTIVDTVLSSTSTNPVQNKVIYSALDRKADKSQINGVLKTFICTTSGNVTSKTLTVDNFVLEKGVTIRVCFENGNDVPRPTLNVSGTGDKEIVVNNYNGYIKRLETNSGSLTTGMYSWGSRDVILTLYYNGTYWVAENTLIYSSDSSTYMLNGEKEVFGKISFGSITDETSKDVLIEDLLFTDTNYNIQVTCESSNAGNETYVLYNTKTTSSVKIRIYNRNSSTKMENVSVYYRTRGY